jgi:uncharacterized RmlC-like cupin family protein
VIESTRPTCRVVHGTASFENKQGLAYRPGISAESVGALGICMHLLTLPPGGRAKAHLHSHHETAIYIVSGQVQTWFGEKLDEQVFTGAGDFLYIPPGMPHLPVNLSQTEPAVALVARTDPNDQESVVLLPELEARTST